MSNEKVKIQRSEVPEHIFHAFRVGDVIEGEGGGNELQVFRAPLESGGVAVLRKTPNSTCLSIMFSDSGICCLSMSYDSTYSKGEMLVSRDICIIPEFPVCVVALKMLSEFCEFTLETATDPR